MGEGKQFDVVVLGGGIGGYVCAIRAAQLGAKVALVERHKLGGVCLHNGCIPTKALLETARVYSLLQSGEKLGVLAGDVQLDWSRALEHKKNVVSQLERGVEFLMKKNHISVLRGEGRLLSAGKVLVKELQPAAETEVSCRDVVVATGSEPLSIPGLKFNAKTVITPYQALALPKVPESAVVVGAGARGLEFVSLWSTLGAQVTVVEKQSRLLPREDAEVSTQLERSLARTGVKVFTNNELRAEDVTPDGDKVRVRLRLNGETAEVEAEKLLLLVGRKGHTRNVGLESTNVQIEGTFVKANALMETDEPHVYAIGDITGGLMLAHVALSEGVLAAERIAGLDVRPLDYGQVPRCVYCHPEEAGLGMTEDEARGKGYDIKVGRFPLRANSCALVSAEPDGFVKVITDSRTGEILGAFMLGQDATELISEFSLSKFLEGTNAELGRSTRPHPTVSEALREAALDVDGLAIHV